MNINIFIYKTILIFLCIVFLSSCDAPPIGPVATIYPSTPTPMPWVSTPYPEHVYDIQIHVDAIELLDDKIDGDIDRVTEAQVMFLWYDGQGHKEIYPESTLSISSNGEIPPPALILQSGMIYDIDHTIDIHNVKPREAIFTALVFDSDDLSSWTELGTQAVYTALGEVASTKGGIAGEIVVEKILSLAEEEFKKSDYLGSGSQHFIIDAHPSTLPEKKQLILSKNNNATLRIYYTVSIKKIEDAITSCQNNEGSLIYDSTEPYDNRDKLLTTTEDRNLRSEPSSSANTIETIQSGEQLLVLDYPVCRESRVWWPVSFEDVNGWMSEKNSDHVWLTSLSPPEENPTSLPPVPRNTTEPHNNAVCTYDAHKLPTQRDHLLDVHPSTNIDIRKGATNVVWYYPPYRDGLPNEFIKYHILAWASNDTTEEPLFCELTHNNWVDITKWTHRGYNIYAHIVKVDQNNTIIEYITPLSEPTYVPPE